MGLVGSGGNAGGAVTQAIFFTSSAMTLSEGFLWMGVMIMGITLFVPTIHFPMWGSMFFKGDPKKTEEQYYLNDFNEDEIAEGIHRSMLNFASESRSQRGFKNAELATHSSPKASDTDNKV